VRLLSEGAEAKVFETSIFGVSAVVKVRGMKRYRVGALDETLRKTRTKKEARAMHRAREAGVSAPGLLGVGKFSLYMEKLEGTMLKDIEGQEAEYGKIGSSLAKMHNVNVVHGDFTPANIMVTRGGGISVIDFGLSDISDSLEDKATDLYLMKRAVSKRQYQKFEDAYKKECRQAEQIVSRLGEMEKRGRYQIRTLA
jgi:Kae1-associated kinase Bud32